MSNTLDPKKIDDIQQEIVDDFSFFEDWGSRYQYLIDLGRKLPPFPAELKTAEHKVSGCQSQVWLVATGHADEIGLQATSDALIVSGLIALILRIYSGQSADTILRNEPWFVAKIGLDKHLSPTRSNGLYAMLNKVREHAARLRGTSARETL